MLWSQRIRTVCVVWLCAGSVVVAGEEKAGAFKDYSPSAERLVHKMLKAIRKLSTYSDDAVLKMETGGPFKQPDQAVGFTYAKSKRFHFATSQHEVNSDGKRLTVYMKSMRRYKVEPLKKDVERQVGTYLGGVMGGFCVGSLVLSSNPRETFSELFEAMDVVGNEEIGGDACMVLAGRMANSMFGLGEAGVPVKLFVRERDFMVRRVELDLLEVMKKQFDDDSGMVMPFKKYLLVYDVRDLMVNESLDEDAFVFEVPSGAKKVDKFYTSWMSTGETAMQFALSGKEVPEFELETVGGEAVSDESLRGKVVLMHFPGRWMRDTSPLLSKLDEIQRAYADKEVAIVLVHPRASAEKLNEAMEQHEFGVTVALDPDGEAVSAFFDDDVNAGTVIIGKDGIVQGRYAAILSKESAKVIRADIGKLLEGETLAGGQPLTEAEVEEAEEQQASRFGFGGTADPLNEEDLSEAWSIRAGSGRSISFGMGSGGGPRGDLWVRSKDVAMRVEADGSVSAELDLPDPSRDQFSQDQLVGGNIGGRVGIVYMKTIPGEEQQMGWRPPKEVVLTGIDANSREIWEMGFEVQNGQLPAQLTLADIDGRGGDEFLFVHQSALWVVNARGETIVRKPIPGMTMWMRAEDRDRDRRAEIYVLTNRKLFRFDYRLRR